MLHPKFRSGSVGPFALGILGFAASLVGTSPARAQVQPVTIRVDSNCTIQQAFQTLNTLLPAGGCEVGTGLGDTVQLGNTTYNLDTRLFINQPATVKGHASGGTKIVAVNLNGTELFWIENNGLSQGMSVTMQDVTLDGTQMSSLVSGIFSPGISDDQKNLGLTLRRMRVNGFTWGGLYLNDASLSMEDSLVEHNHSPDGGGGIRTSQVTFGSNNIGLFLVRCTLAENSSEGSGGGLYTEVAGNSNIDSSTISNNVALAQGGGLFSNNLDYLHVRDSTVAFNTAGEAGGGFAAVQATSFHFNTSIIGQNVNNGAPFSPDGYMPEGLTVNFFDSLIGNTSGVTINNTSSGGPNILGVNPQLDAVLFDLGGSSHQRVHRLLPGSPAMDYWFTNNQPPDQRGYPAPRDGDGNGSKIRDLGAYEHDPNWQTEVLLVAGKSSDAHVLASTSTGDTSTTFSNALGTNLQSNATNDFVTYAVPVIQSGNHTVKVRVRKGSNRGRFQLAWSNSPTGPWTNIGSVQDLYSSTTSFSELSISTSTNLGTSGQKYFRFLVTGKNSQSSGYQLMLDTIQLIKFGA